MYSLYRSKNLTKTIYDNFDQHYLSMETTFMSTENSKTNEFNKFIYQFTDKFNIKNPNNRNIGLVNLSIYYTWKTLNHCITTIYLKHLLPIGMMNLICLMLLFNLRHSWLPWIYHQKARNVGWKCSHTNLFK